MILCELEVRAHDRFTESMVLEHHTERKLLFAKNPSYRLADQENKAAHHRHKDGWNCLDKRITDPEMCSHRCHHQESE